MNCPCGTDTIKLRNELGEEIHVDATTFERRAVRYQFRNDIYAKVVSTWEQHECEYTRVRKSDEIVLS